MFRPFKLIAFITFFLLSSCKDEVCNCEVDKSMQKQNDSIFTLVDNYWRKVSFWERVNEPRLDTLKSETYRVYQYSLFDDLVKIHRLEKRGDCYQLYVKYYHSKEAFSGKQDSLPMKDMVIPVTKEDWTKVQKLMTANCFWTMPTKMNREGCLDEDRLFLEANNPSINCPDIKPYHCSFGSCVDSLKGYKYFQLCDLLLNLEKEMK